MLLLFFLLPASVLLLESYALQLLFLHPCTYLFLLTSTDSFLVSLPPINAGLPLNIAALMPMLMVHFDQPDDFCVGCAQTLSKVQWGVHLMYGMTIIHPPACMNTHVHPNVLIHALH